MLDSLTQIDRQIRRLERWLPDEKPAPTGKLAEEAEGLSGELSAYIREAWHIVEPRRDYVHGWHIDAICEHLTACTRREIKNLIINIPPRHMKSLSVVVFWPTWTWTWAPGSQWLTASYAMELAVRDAVKSRRIIQSPWYQARWGHIFQLSGDQNRKMRYENDQGGHRIASGLKGKSLGEGGDYLIIDDPLKQSEADSDAARETSNDFWDQTMSTRGNDPDTVVKVIIMQRLHNDDLTGHVLEKARKNEMLHYEHLCLPAEYEPRTYASAIDFEDPRDEPDALLWPERFSREALETLKAEIGSEREVAAQLQQRPAPEAGNIFQRTWWAEGRNRWDAESRAASNRCIGRWISFDTALKDDEANDYTAWGVYELWPDYRLAKRDAEWKRLQFPQLASEIEDQARRWNYDGKLKGILIEDKGSGTSALQTLRQGAEEWIARLLVEFNPTGSKVYRARQASVWCDRDMVLLPGPSVSVPWLLEWEETLYDFPAVTHDDTVDEFSMAIIYLENYLAEGWRARLKRGTREPS
jgi:predicted phage terminase large subunit-like protein